MAKRRRRATADEVRALAHPLRLRIIRVLYDGPRSNKELAGLLHEDPATVLYHVRTLTKTGFVAPAGARGARGSTEKLYRSTGKSWRVDVDTGLPEAGRVSSAVVQATVAELRDAGSGAELQTSRLALQLTAAEQEEFGERVQALLDEFEGRTDDPDGERVAVFYVMYRRA